MTSRPLVWIKVVHPVKDAQQRRFPASRRPDKGGHLPVVKGHADALQGTMVAIEEIQVPDGDLFDKVLVLGQRMGDGRYSNGCYGHDVFLWAARMRATMLRKSTAKVMINAPVHARLCQSL